MATLLGVERDGVTADPLGHARRAASALGAVVALKGPESHVAEPGGGVHVYRDGSVGLATSGSGDTLAGWSRGCAARGAPPAQAAAWGVFLHGEAGNVLRSAPGAGGVPRPRAARRDPRGACASRDARARRPRG
jgi:NAD(P)H-hydrate repair Nnr-like enzyme with NAD(P)H-hydrate dehydratase domain